MSPPKKKETFTCATSLTNTCYKPLLLYENRTVPPLVCHGVRIYCEVDYNDCLSLCLAVRLPTCIVPSTSVPLDSRNMSYFQTCLASLPSFHFFHSSPKPVSLLGSLYLGQRCAVNGVLTTLWTDPKPPSIFCPHPLEHLFQM